LDDPNQYFQPAFFYKTPNRCPNGSKLKNRWQLSAADQSVPISARKAILRLVMNDEQSHAVAYLVKGITKINAQVEVVPFTPQRLL
jgi:hypothetical protein